MNQRPPEQLLVMGRIGAPFGVKGWIKVQPNTAATSNLLAFGTWWIGSEGNWQECAVEEARVQGDAVVARLAGCEDRDAAVSLRGKTVAVPRAALSPARSGEYYWADLIGLEVVSAAAVPLGRVAGMMQTGANDVMVVQGERERLIPFVAVVIRKVDLGSGTIQVEWDADY